MKKDCIKGSYTNEGTFGAQYKGASNRISKVVRSHGSSLYGTAHHYFQEIRWLPL